MQLARGSGGPAAPIHKGPLITPVPGTAGVVGIKEKSTGPTTSFFSICYWF